MKEFGLRWYILDHERQPVRVTEMLDWARWLEHADRHVGLDHLDDGVVVSTVFIGLDHRFDDDGPPLIFETMIFNGALDGEGQRYSTWDDAEIGHAMWLKKAKQNSEAK